MSFLDKTPIVPRRLISH